ncbi:hypothetical protein [Actinoallomurus bryophytorum]|uniref:hypothetical protein n=1 Tax=Actinoallomurus bryophytorum TaxID=1490222 RepID=UPI0011514FAD|nr:hypothetical protein [Actinoallomurus bryophytorum]
MGKFRIRTQEAMGGVGNYRLRTAVAAASACLFIASCGGNDTRRLLPRSTSTTPSHRISSFSTEDASQDSKDAATAAYKSFFDAAAKAITSPPEQARLILREYTAGAYLDWEIRQVMTHQANHQEPWGKPIVHVTQVDLQSNKARIHDCQDASNAGLSDTKTHQLVPNTRGTTNRNLVANMTRGDDGRWRVTGLKQYPSACHVP